MNLDTHHCDYSGYCVTCFHHSSFVGIAECLGPSLEMERLIVCVFAAVFAVSSTLNSGRRREVITARLTNQTKTNHLRNPNHAISLLKVGSAWMPNLGASRRQS